MKIRVKGNRVKIPSDPVTVNGERTASAIAVQPLHGEKARYAVIRKPGNLLDW